MNKWRLFITLMAISITVNNSGSNSSIIVKSTDGAQSVQGFLTDERITLIRTIYAKLAQLNTLALIAELTFLDNGTLKIKLGMTNDEVIVDYDLNVLSVPSLPIVNLTGDIALPILLPLINSINSLIKPHIYEINFTTKTIKINPLIPELDGFNVAIISPPD